MQFGHVGISADIGSLIEILSLVDSFLNIKIGRRNLTSCNCYSELKLFLISDDLEVNYMTMPGGLRNRYITSLKIGLRYYSKFI